MSDSSFSKPATGDSNEDCPPLNASPEYQAGYRAGERLDYAHLTFEMVQEEYGKSFALGWNRAWKESGLI